MDETIDLSTEQLAQTYARYFVKDITLDIMRHLSGSHPIDPDHLEAFVDQQISQSTSELITNTNTLCRFLYECAEHVLAQNWTDPESPETWSRVSVLPSIHHPEINQLIYGAADLYRRTMDQTILGVVAKDAHIAAKSIIQASQSRVAVTETGGVLNFFNWGILSDGLWLNAALHKAFDLAKLFGPGDPVVSYYTRVAFEEAQRRVNQLLVMDDEALAHAHGELNLIQGEIGDDVLIPYTDFAELLLSPQVAHTSLGRWNLGLTDPAWMISAITELSQLATQIRRYQEAVAALDTDLIGDEVKTRLSLINDIITLVLVGYEALRETKFDESLILLVATTQNENDPTVNVTINEDLYRSFTAAGGSDSDLVHFGSYLDPRKGIPTPSAGWSLAYVLARRDDVVPEELANQADRLERLRNNDAAVIQSETTRIVTQLVNSYLDAKEETMLPFLAQRIDALARKVTMPETDVDLDQEISLILITVINDPVVTTMSNRFFTYITNPDFANVGKDAAAFAIAGTAVDDIVGELSAIAPIE